MKRTKLMIGTMILGLGMAGAAWAQPAPDHDRDARVYNSYSRDRDDGNRARADRGRVAWRDAARDDHSGWGRGDRDDRNERDRDARSWWNWSHNHLRRDPRDDR